MSLAVFLGPSLPCTEAEAILEADFRPPVRQGDIYRLVRRARPQAIAVIDGYFQEVPSVWHKEILWALDQGIPVYGAASMGALRAAELDRHGMVGIGKIYEAYRSGRYAPYEDEIFEDDDEVAVIHGPAELSFPALSDAMVDLRETLAAATREGIIDAKLRDALVAAFKRRFYRERSFETLPEILSEIGAAGPSAEVLLDWLPKGRRSQKRADARALLEALANSAPELPADRERFVFERTSLWAQFVEQSADATAGISAAEAGVLHELRLDARLYDTVYQAAALWCRLESGDVPAPLDDSARRAALDNLRRRRGLLSREALESWAEDCDLDRAGLDRLLHYEAVLGEGNDAGAALDRALLDVLRSSGRYASLAARARDKETCLEQAEVSGSAPSALSSETLLDWYFEERLGRVVPTDVAHYALARGFADLTDFLTAIDREKAYLAQKAAAGDGKRP